MKRLHVHVAVNNIPQSIGFYSALFAAPRWLQFAGTFPGEKASSFESSIFASGETGALAQPGTRGNSNMRWAVHTPRLRQTPESPSRAETAK
jgi:hypothetical protein